MLKLFDETRKHRVFGRGKDWIGSYKIAITKKKKKTPIANFAKAAIKIWSQIDGITSRIYRL